MLPRSSDVYAFFVRYTEAVEPHNHRTFIRRTIEISFDDGPAARAELRDVRHGCCMIEVGNSIFTLAYSDVLDIVPPAEERHWPLVKSRVGALATHARARLRARERRAPLRLQEPARLPRHLMVDAVEPEAGAAVVDAEEREQRVYSLEEIERDLVLPKAS